MAYANPFIMRRTPMRVLKHAILSLLRKPTKAIMIFIILLVVFGLVFTGIIIQNSIVRSKEFVRTELGALVELKADYAKAMKDQIGEDKFVQLSLPTSLAKEIAKDSAVKKLYISDMAGVTNPSLESAQKEGAGGSIRMATGPGGEASFILLGSNESVPLEFEYGSLILTQGHHPEAEDQGRDTLLLSEEFASKNNLSLGDTVDLTSPMDNKTYSFEVIGIFSGYDSFAVDQMYTSLESVKKLAGAKADVENAASINFALNDPLEVDAFIARHENQMPSEYTYLYASDTEYETLTRPLDLMSTITSILLWVVFVAGAIIMIAIVTIFVRDRKFEIGLLLSSGETKIKIVSQFILEILIVSFLAFIVSAGASNLTSDYAANWIVNNQLVEDETSNEGNMFISKGFGSVQNDVNMSDVADDFDISIDIDVILNLVLISFGLILFSTSAPLLIILSYKPRESLQD